MQQKPEFDLPNFGELGFYCAVGRDLALLPFEKLAIQKGKVDARKHCVAGLEISLSIKETHFSKHLKFLKRNSFL